MLYRPASFLLALAAATAFTAQASTREVRIQLDARQLRPGLLAGQDAGGSLPLAAGDTLSVDISFLPGQALQVDGPLSFSLFTPGKDLGAAIDLKLLNTLTLRGADGRSFEPASATQLVRGNALQSLFFGTQLGLPMSGSLSLSGLSFTTTVLSYGDAASQHVFGDSRLSVLAANLGTTVSAVPEPSPLGLALAGLGVLGLWSARRQRVVRCD